MARSTRKAIDARIAEVEAALAADYLFYQYHAVEFVAGHICDLSKEFGGDLSEMLVMAIIGQMELHRRLSHVEPEAVARPAISASRIADVSGIPRQTVRRKLSSLARRGWIEEADNASWRIRIVDGASPAHKDLSAVDQRKMRRIAELFANLETLVARP